MGKPKMKECCAYFFKANGLQNILNGPLQHCGYCGYKLTNKEFAYVKDHYPLPEYMEAVREKQGARMVLEGKNPYDQKTGEGRELARGRYHDCETYKYLGIRWDDWHEFRFVSNPPYGESPAVALSKLRT